ncbi:MAG: hypothetical protein H6641_20320 [Caldilineaceae bacterium]|nr:hypothetical protein [Caldilineaceae bacterium]
MLIQFILPAAPLHAQTPTPYLIKPFTNRTADARPGLLTAVNDVVYFLATGTTGSGELWRTDGTGAGTTLLKDVGGCSYPVETGCVPWMVNVEGTLYFRTEQSVWRSDGTVAGTTLLFEGDASAPTALGDSIYFTSVDAADPTTTHLWKSDGTSAGTTLVKTFQSYKLNCPVARQKRLYCRTVDGLWKSDGTASGTTLVKTIPVESGIPGEPALSMFNDTIYFWVRSTGSTQLWRSDGSADGTTPLKDFPIYDLSVDRFIGVIGSEVYFVVRPPAPLMYNEIWKSNGTPEGTLVVEYIEVKDFTQSEFAVLNDKIYVNRFDVDHGVELWYSNGVSGGMTFVKDINPGAADATPMQLTAFQNKLYFFANDGVHGAELWQSDGTDAGTQMVKEILPGPTGAGEFGSTMLATNTFLYFSAMDANTGLELWRSDGAAANTILLQDVNTNRNLGQGSSTPLTKVDNLIYFSASDQVNPPTFWVSDGTPSGTFPLELITQDASITSIFHVYFAAEKVFLFTMRHERTGGPYLPDIWVTNRPLTATSQAQRIYKSEPPTSSELIDAVMMGTELYFIKYEMESGLTTLWASDGSASGTHQIKQIATSSYPQYQLMKAGDRLFFAVRDYALSEVDFTLWGSDGSENGTIALKTFKEIGILPNSVGNLLFFMATDGANGMQLWRSDGTQAGTMAIKAIDPDYNSTYVASSVVYSDTLYFGAGDSISQTLWRSDGTEGGTQIAVDNLPGFNSPVVFQDAIYFTSILPNDEAQYGSALWRTNQNMDGIELVQRFGECQIDELRVDQDTLYFGCNPWEGNQQMWAYDGANAPYEVGELFTDRVTGLIANHTFYFTEEAPDGPQGLWALPLQPLEQHVYLPVAKRSPAQ